MKLEKKYLLGIIGLIVILLTGVSYAYFKARINGDPKSIVIKSKGVYLEYKGDTTLSSGEIGPGWSVTKTFTVENQGSNTEKYDIYIEDLVNTFVTTGNLQYKITSSTGYNMTEFKDIPKSETATDTVLAYSVSIDAGVTQSYTITLKYNDTDDEQSGDMGKKFSGTLGIKIGTVNSVLLTDAMLRDNPTISERTDFSVTNTETTTGTLYKTNKTEDGSDVYYYSGNTTNNWVKFGGFYWRIIRTNEDGSVRMLYAGTSHDTTSGYIGETVYNNLFNDPMYVGYMYGTSGSLENNRLNTNDSTIKTFIDNWYQNNLLTNYDKYISKTAIYCNDRSVGSGTYSISVSFNYGAYTRLRENKYPTYKCGGNGTGGLFESTQATADKFSASTSSGGNGQLKYPIALMTADEISFAGGVFPISLSSPYAWYYTNSASDSITGTGQWVLISPFWWSGSISDVFFVNSSYGPGGLGNRGSVGNSAVVRPAISLSSCVKVTGTGTPEDPYVVDYDNSCK